MELRLLIDSQENQKKLKQNMDKAGQMVRTAMRQAATDASMEIMFRGAEDIAEAGNFGDRWQEALTTETTETQRTIRIETFMRGGPPVSYWKVFEMGAHITPKNPSGFLWLPFRGAPGVDVWPRAYAGELFRAKSQKGTPLLGDKAAMAEARTKDEKNRAWRYFGLAEVHIGQKFHLRKIIADVAKELRIYYRDHIRSMRP
jgi:hypothetical protein